MTRYAIGDVQGCDRELRELLERLRFSPDRDRLWFVGDLVNRGPGSLAALRLVRSLGDAAVVVLGNHDLHLLALVHGGHGKRASDTLDEVLAAPDRDGLLEWLITRPLAHYEHGDLLVHAGLVPQWSVGDALGLAREVETALRHEPRPLLERMYGNEPDRWDPALAGAERLRFVINVLTRLRVCTADGRVDLAVKGEPPSPPAELRPWFELEARASRGTRIVFGHWSALGLVLRDGVVGLDSGCVWGGALTAFDLDAERPPVSVPCRGYQRPDV
ncbi:MAG TPA: symmetrical bis(5'-nucleosyl)-tetraphosphatase [Steroidobacteraceae bacterium]|nr:symmetrical bis(5'-nucleosyl)-tetraphosphatase [Steroidobacteraceae bacterium]